MTLPRTLEPELMDTAEEARDYDAMDHAAVNLAFARDALAARAALTPGAQTMLDVGTGTALIPIAMCELEGAVTIEACDLAAHMLELAARNVARAGLDGRVRLTLADGKRLPYEDGAFPMVVSNTILHHMARPEELLGELWRVTAPGGVLFLRDLERPETREDADALVALHAGEPPRDEERAAAHGRQRGLLEASLHAALTRGELARHLASLAIPVRSLERTSDRHLTLVCVKP